MTAEREWRLALAVSGSGTLAAMASLDRAWRRLSRDLLLRCRSRGETRICSWARRATRCSRCGHRGSTTSWGRTREVREDCERFERPLLPTLLPLRNRWTSRLSGRFHFRRIGEVTTRLRNCYRKRLIAANTVARAPLGPQYAKDYCGAVFPDALTGVNLDAIPSGPNNVGQPVRSSVCRGVPCPRPAGSDHGGCGRRRGQHYSG